MKCKKAKLLMMDFLYDEIDDASKSLLKTHLYQCRNCQTEFNRLKNIPEFLDQWQDEPVPINVTFSTDTNRFIDYIRHIFKFQYVKRVGFAMATILLFLALFNVELSYDDGNFFFSASLFPEQNSPEFSPEIMAQLRYENFKLTTELLDNYETKDDKKTLLLMDKMITELRQERNQQLQNVVGTVNDAYTTNDIKIQQTHHTIEELVELINHSSQK